MQADEANEIALGEPPKEIHLKAGINDISSFAQNKKAAPLQDG